MVRSLPTNHEVPVSIPCSTVGIFLEGEDSRGDHGLGRLVEFRFKAPPGTTSSSINTHTPSGQCNCTSWASQSQKSVTLLPCPGGRTTKSTNDMWWHWGEEKNFLFLLMNNGRLEWHKNVLKTNRRLLYLKTQSVPRCKHFSSRL